MEFGHAEWRKSSFSTDQTECVEIAYPGGLTVGIRDSKNSGGGHLILPATALRHLTAAVVFHHR